MVITKKAVDSEYYKNKTRQLLKKLDINYNNVSYYINSFIHKSIVNERPDFTPKDNERLEFLGDAVLELIITDNLFNDFPEKPEGELTDMRSSIVRGTNLANIAIKLNLEEHLLLGKGEELSGGRNNNYLLANLVEAFLGAIYTDLGYDTACDFVNKYIYPSLKDITKSNSFKDYKTLVQELAQSNLDITPHYEVISESGPDHNKNFVVGVFLGKKKIGEGTGTSKKKAQEEAAKNGYNKISN